MPLSATVFGSGTPVVLLPGFALDGAVMAAACEPAFTGSPAGQWQRIYLDLPGTGGSPAGEPSSEAVLAAIRAAVTERIGDAPFLLAGHSYGGYLATGLARREPDRVAGLLAITAGLRIRPADRDLSGVQPSVPEPGWLDGVPDDLRQHFDQAVGRQSRAVADRLVAAFTRRGPIDEGYLDALRPDGYQLGDEGAATTFTGPVTLLAGRRDRIAGYRDAFAALERYPNATLTVLADAGHYLPFERPAEFALAVLDWLNATEAKNRGLAGDAG